MATREGGNSLVDQFIAITGADKVVAERLLEACNGNLEMAIGMHIDGAAGQEEPGPTPGTSSRVSSAPLQDDEDDIRAPDPQKHEVLVHESYSFGFRGRRRTTRSVFDGFRDFQAEARQQEIMQDEGKVHKRKTLEDLFRPPIDLVFKGTFHAAKEYGSTSNKWLMVNIQNVQEFSCQALNRDVWSHAAVKTIIQEHFVFWQVYHDSEEGQKFIRFYPVDKWPYIAILDPQTGEKMVVWSKVDHVSFCDIVTDFLTHHPSPDGSATTSPAKTVQRSDSIIDASEDSQMAAAIQASLKSNQDRPSRNTKSSPSTVTLDSDSDSQEFSGSELETFSDSDVEDSTPMIKSGREETQCSNKDKTTSNSDGISNGVNSIRKGKVKDTQDTQSGEAENRKRKSSSNIVGSAEKKIKESQSSKPERWKDFLGPDTDPLSKVIVRFPENKRETFEVPCSSKLRALVLFVEEHGFPNERYEMVTTFPRKKISHMDFDDTLKQCGLFPQETVFVQGRS
ncbi:UBX domain-containing protein 7 [Lingula anatina]|uniref:UBX domain-containing protein 7 n=1 Tax=Lingula anatina TaxID=7574 RepID=A0A1S3HBL0_LINAN|nr:UBX domain-containing protein 7 [Lingula anatina]|eukprot:XP_013383412.1 UBX domain-containing protein 7 [Lingula anatina]